MAKQHLQRERNGALFGVHGAVRFKKCLTAPALSEMPPDAAARTEDRQGGHGAKTGGSFVLDDAQGMGLRAVEKVRFARGKARTSRWCEVKHRPIEWVSRSPSRGSSN